MQDSVTLTLTTDEALVLFAFLQRFELENELRLDDPSEERALWNLNCLLERELVEPFLADYSERLAAARERLHDLIES